MNADDLTTDQAKEINAALYGSLNYLCRLRERMEKKGFKPDDPLFVLVEKAYDAMRRLTGDLHYRSCSSGVGRPSTKT